ncbi:MAG: Hpt domain-containing protein [Chitinophagales bacterium]|nr:Hpt domain-containing protein [Chitinophagales bacterium]
MEKHYNLEFLNDYYGDDREAMVEILRLYLQETPKDLNNIKTALHTNNAAAAKAATHKIKTNVAMLGMHDPVEFMHEMHLHSAQADVSEKVKKLFVDFEAAILEGLADIKRDFFSES